MTYLKQLYYCKDTGEECVGINTIDNVTKYKCLIHGWQNGDHFELETEWIKTCEICNNGFYCKDDIRKTCSIVCARKYAEMQ